MSQKKTVAQRIDRVIGTPMCPRDRARLLRVVRALMADARLEGIREGHVAGREQAQKRIAALLSSDQFSLRIENATDWSLEFARGIIAHTKAKAVEIARKG